MLANARNPQTPTVHHGILAAPGSECMWVGTLCDPKLRGLHGHNVQVLERTTKQVTCLRCLRTARKRRA